MYSIGRFSKITGINVKTLVWYDKIGLLKPEKTNIENGYRYYGNESIKKVFEIQFLQSLGFSIQEIINLSKEIISDKIEELQKKIDYIQMNISLLQKLKEENNMKNLSIFTMSENIIQGKWDYTKTTTSFKEAADWLMVTGKKEEWMPNRLFFGESNVGTDLNDVFGYSNFFTLFDNEGNPRDFCYFVLNHLNTLVLYENPRPTKNKTEAEKPIKLHVYTRSVFEQHYTRDDIYTIFNKYRSTQDDKEVEFNKNLVGKYDLVDEITESQIANYKGSKKKKTALFEMHPIFDIIEINEDKSVFIMEEGKELNLNNKKIFNRANTKISIYNIDNETFVLNNTFTKEHLKYRGISKTIDGTQYLFVNLVGIANLDEDVYVFRKRKEN